VLAAVGPEMTVGVAETNPEEASVVGLSDFETGVGGRDVSGVVVVGRGGGGSLGGGGVMEGGEVGWNVEGNSGGGGISGGGGGGGGSGGEGTGGNVGVGN